ncbi:MAG: transcription repressor NadR [Lachnospiraceae bacterium]|nr:transcription repressor NadR [Lachnospiraceae bacterium]
METENRRLQILHLLENQQKPVSGTVLARLFGVSRQVIVQDIALLRAENRNILSTNKGYVLFKRPETEETFRRVLCVRHSMEQMEEELNCIVDNGGHVLDVSVEHDLYGQISADLIIHNRADVAEFIDKMKVSNSQPLKVLTGDIHYHTIGAKEIEMLDRIEKKLDEKGFIVRK